MVHRATAAGDSPPLRTLSLNNSPVAVFVDEVNDELVVVYGSTHVVDVFARTASGSTPPIRRLSGPATKLAGPFDAVVDSGRNELLCDEHARQRRVARLLRV
jgi:hypothetical protein